ncbi:uncharacterized protein JCM6883_004822 [Sporobolomyces salmoneus]|uniref:uncharacterized protein n=1 Tax=Sporobolomyces salmoneus TaxID=183962 RepID=UPI00317CA1FE
MSDRRGPPPSRSMDYYPPPPPRDYDRRPPPPPMDDYRGSDRRVPPPLPPHATHADRFDPRDPYSDPYAHPSMVSGRRREEYDEYRGNLPVSSLPPSADGRGKRRRSISPGPPHSRRGGEYDSYPPRDSYRSGPPPPVSYRGDYPPPPPSRPLSPPPPPSSSAYYRGGDPVPPPSSSGAGGYYRGAPPPVSSTKLLEAPHHLPYVVTHRYFTDWFHSSNPSSDSLTSSPEALELAWKKYLAEYRRKSLRPRFEEGRGMEWFKERYEPGPKEQGREERGREGTKGRAEEWKRKMQEGEWENVTMSFDEEAAKTSTKPSSTTAPTEKNGGDATMKEQKKPSPSLGDGLLSLNPETVLIPSRPNRLIVETIPSNVGYSELHTIFSPLEGFVRLSTSDGDPSAEWTRTGWVTFDTEEQATKALESLSEVSIGDYKLSLSQQSQPQERQIRATPSIMSTPERIRKDLEIVESIVEYLERELELQEGDKKGSELIRAMRDGWEKEVEEKKGKGQDVTKEENEVVRKTLDFYLHYLRYAFNTCYYCVTRCSSPEALEHVCPRHVRRVGPALPSDVGFVKALDEKVPLLDDHSKLDLRDFGAELKEETLFSLCSPYIKNEEEGKFRCKECNKLFSARKFVEKHIVTKHGQFVNDALSQAQFFNNYILDPSHHPLSEFQTTNSLPSLLPSSATPSLADRIGGRRRNGSISSSTAEAGNHKRQKRDGPPPPPPKGAVLDPRASRGQSSYADLDGTPGGAPDVVELPY